MSAFIETFVCRAASVDDVLSDLWAPVSGIKADADRSAKRLAAWCKSSASGDWKLFSKRLSRDGLSFEKVLPRLGTTKWAGGANYPEWAVDAQWILDAFRDVLPAEEYPRYRITVTPFEDLIVPIVKSAWLRCSAKVAPSALGLFAESAQVDLRHALASRLSDLCAPSIYAKLVAVRSEPHKIARSNGSGLYQSFIQQLRQGHELFDERPVLLRLLAVVTRQWIESTAELVERLLDDEADIKNEILEAGGTIRVIGVRANLSDPHNGGRTVHVLELEGNARIVYKPKDIQIDRQWQLLLADLNSADPPIDLKSAKVLPRLNYGWSEYIEPLSCLTVEGIERFYRRSGALLCLFHVLSGTDMHEENMIACGDQPVAIDLEMLLQPLEGEQESTAPERRSLETAVSRLANSVLRTGLLPAYSRSPERHVISHGGLHNPHHATTGVVWDSINSDDMKPKRVSTGFQQLANLPMLGGSRAALGDYVSCLLAGFSEYQIFLDNYARGKGRSQITERFSNLNCRRILRPTRYYALLLERLRDHRNLTDGVTWSLHADFGARMMDFNADEDPLWEMLKVERLELLNLDVPFFVSPVDQAGIASPTGIRATLVETPALEVVRQRLDALGDVADREWQCDVIRLSTSTTSSHLSPTGPVTKARPPAAKQKQSSNDLVGLTKEIFSQLQSTAIRSGPSATWIGLDWLGDAEVCQLSPLGSDLYNGSTGVSLFLAAYGKVFGNESAIQLSWEGVARVCSDLRGATAGRIVRGIGIGGAIGLGSVVYGLSTLARLLQRTDILAEAEFASQLFSPDVVKSDVRIDCLEGSAGAVLGLLALYRANQSIEVLERASVIGRHLINTLEKRRALLIGDRQRRLIPLNGMSHGAAGIAYSLSALSRATGQAKFGEIAIDLVREENESFDQIKGAWPDFRMRGADQFKACQWCHGAAGIGLARIGTLRFGQHHQSLTEDIQRATNAVIHADPNPIDNLCCGELGCVEFLREGADVLGMPRLAFLASERLTAVIEQAKTSGDFVWGVGDRRYNLGLFRGIAGVGYSILREIDASLPNPLIWG